MTISSLRWSISLLLGGALAAPAQPCVPAPAGLSAWVTFDEPLFQRANRIPGHIGQAVRFDGVAQFFQFPPTPGFNVGKGDFTIELWVRSNQNESIRNIADFRSPGPTGWLLYNRRGEAGFQVADGPRVSDTIAYGYPIANGAWHHIVGVARRLPPQAPALYVDGRLRAQTGKTITLGNLDHDTPLWLARHHRNAYVDRDNMFFRGDIDDLAVYRRALSPAEIAALYKAGRAGKCHQ